MYNSSSNDGCFEWVAIIIAMLIGAAIISFPGTFIMMLFWDSLIEPIFNAPNLTFWQMYGLWWFIYFLPTGSSVRGSK